MIVEKGKARVKKIWNIVTSNGGCYEVATVCFQMQIVEKKETPKGSHILLIKGMFLFVTVQGVESVLL